MRRFASVIFGLLMFLAFAVSAAKPTTYRINYTGTIGKNLNIHMSLVFEGNTVTGTYFYDKHKVVILLKGRKVNGYTLALQEYDAGRRMSGKFSGEFSTIAHLEGLWSKPDGSKSLPFRVEAMVTQEPANPKVWKGERNLMNKTQFRDARLTISKTSSASFVFSISAFDGSHTGEVEGTASIRGNGALWQDKETGCSIRFLWLGPIVSVRFTGDTSHYAGMGVWFDGDYFAGEIPVEIPSLLELGVFADERDDKVFRNLVGEDYALFTDSFQLISEDEDLDGLRSRVFVGAIRGLFTINEGIIMIGLNQRCWAAVIDSEDRVRYYTNVPEYANRLPQTIENWRNRFPEKTVLWFYKPK